MGSIMSVYYEDGELSRIIFNEKPQERPRARLYNVGTHITFVRQIVQPAQRIAVVAA
jgi:hypothetical protein